MTISGCLRRTSESRFLFAAALISAAAFTLQTQIKIRAATPATYYVAVTGNDNNPGTAISPWRTIQRAASALSAGSTALVNAGTYSERVLVSNSGTPGALMTFQAEGRV